MTNEIKDRIEKVNRGEVPQGYKKTVVGIVPQEWEEATVGHIVKEMKSGLSRQLRDEDIGLPVVRSNNLVNGKVDFSDMKYWHVNDPQGADTNLYILEENDILINFINSTAQIGKVSVFSNLINRKIIYTTNILRMRVNSKSIYNYFLHYSKSSWYRNNILLITKPAVNQASFTTKDFAKIPIILPALKEQQRIAKILSKWDEAIELQEKLIDKLEDQKKALMQKLLTPKDRWVKVKLGDTGVITTGLTPPTSNTEYYGGTYPWITPTDITISKYICTSERKLTQEGINKGRLIKSGSILITCIASIGKNAILTEDGSCNQQINAITVNSNFSNEFIFYLMEYNIDILIKFSGTSATSIINKETFNNLLFSMPLLKEQIEIAEILSGADKKIELFCLKLKKLKQQQKSMQQLLLTGIVRV